jgi:hypothetical protein
MYAIQHNLATLYSCDKTGITIVQRKHTKILGLKDKLQISSVQSAGLGSLVTVITCLSPTGHFIPLLLISEKICETRTDEWHTARINPHVPFLGVDTERDFHPVVSSFHQIYTADKIRSLCLSTGQTLSTHKEPGGYYFSLSESC